MNFEGLENWRAKLTEETMTELVKIIKDDKHPVADRIKAAEVVDRMSDSIIKAALLSEHTKGEQDTVNKLANKLDKLVD